MKPARAIISSLRVLVFSMVLSLFSVNQSHSMDRTLRWQASPAPDILGYELYYGIGSRHPENPDPYKGTEANEGSSPVDMSLSEDENPDPEIVEFTLTGLNDGTAYFFAVKAYDEKYLYSGFSNEEAILCISWPTGGLYVNDENDAPYTITGRADKQTEVELYYDAVGEDTKLGEAAADDNRDWELDVEFEAEFAEGPVILIVKSKSNGITAPAVTATYDPTNPTSQATSATNAGSFVTVTWSAADATSGVALTELWCKPPGGSWSGTGFRQTGTSGTSYYRPAQGDGTYYFATRSVDKAGNWEAEPNGDGDTSINYIASITTDPTGKEGGGAGCFITTAAPGVFSKH